MSEEINTKDEYIDCTECEGTGEQTVSEDTYSVPSYRQCPCQSCYGEKQIENEDYDYNLNETIEL